MPEQYTKVEIIKPHKEPAEWVGAILAGLFLMAVRVLIVWWAIATWFPELGITYWQIILPVYAVRLLATNPTITPRILKK